MVPAAVRRGALWLGLVLAAGACGDERPRGVRVTEAADAPLPPTGPRRVAPLDTVYPDPGLYADPRLDSLRQDSLRRDSGGAAGAPPTGGPPRAEPSAAAPDFGAFWPRWRDAARQGAAPAAALAVFSDAMSRADFDAAHAVALDEPFRAGVLALTARDFRRDGTARVASVVVGYDAGGAVVPQDEAVAEARASLRFDVVDGAYRLVSLAVRQP